MKRIGINILRFAIALYCVASSTGLVQQHEHRHNRDTNQKGSPTTPPSAESASTLSRRTFGIMGSASLSSLLIGGPSTYSARADPYNAFIPAGSRMLQQRATIQRAEGWATNGPPQLLTELGMSRIGTTSDDSSSSRSISPLQGSPSPFASRELYYPPSFVGDWNVTATLQQKIFPYGPDFVLSRSLVEGSPRNRGEQVGDSTSYVARYISANNGEPQAIADRGFNIVSMSRSYKQSSPVIADSIQWDSTKDPTRLSFQRESVTADMRPVGPVKAEVYLTARKTEELLATTTNEDDERIFASDERSRTVTLGTGSVTADDCEIITEFRRIDNDTIQAVSRFAVYLTPNPNSMEGVLWQQVNGKAVAFYDYEMLMERKKE
jgi:hypothetical protein